MKIDPRFKKGLRLSNQGKFFECHEVIEELWLETPKDDKYRDLYKGVIQAAAAIYQAERGIMSGALGLYKTSVKYLSEYAPSALGLNVRKLINDLKDFFGPLIHPVTVDADVRRTGITRRRGVTRRQSAYFSTRRSTWREMSCRSGRTPSRLQRVRGKQPRPFPMLDFAFKNE